MRVIGSLLVIGILWTSCGVINRPEGIESEPTSDGFLSINESEEIKLRDSLVKKIDEVSSDLPNDLKNTTLIIETYGYKDFLKQLDSKYTIHLNTRKNRARYRLYRKNLERLFSWYKNSKVFADKGSYDALEINKHRYVLKTVARFTEKSITYPNGGSGREWKTTLMNYLYDRKLNVILGEINDQSILK